MKSKRNQAAFQATKAQLEELCKAEQKGEVEVYFYDESTFSLVPYIPYAWQEKAKPICILPASKSNRVNIAGFLKRDNTFHAYQLDGNMNAETLVAIMDDFSESITKKTFVFLDNAPAHRAKYFQDHLKRWEDKNLFITYLPAYSPELNKIEILWKHIKYEWLSFKAYADMPTLIEYLTDILKNIGSTYCINFNTT